MTGEGRSASVRVFARAAFVLSVLLACASSGVAHAQGLGIFSGGSDPLDGTTADREAVLETLDTSFLRELLERLEEARRRAGDDFVPFHSERDLERARQDYLAAASARLFELEGDGSLTLGEVASNLPSIRERHAGRFEDVVEARALGYPPPPRREAFGSAVAYAGDMARYIALVRNPPSAWGQLALYAGAGVLIALALSWALGRISRRVSSREHTVLASTLDSIRPPLVLAAAAAGLLVGLDVLWLPSGVESVVRTTLEIVIVGLAFLACWNLCDEIAGAVAEMVRRATGRESIEHVRGLIQRALRVLVIVLFLLVVSRVLLGVSLTGLLAGLGVIGIGLWILTRGLVENVAASFTLFGDRVFRIGDTIIHRERWGVIEDIGFRSTRCRTFDGHMLHIPNRNLVDDTVWNVSARPYIRRRFRLSLVYDTPPEKIEEAMGIVHAVIEEEGDRVNREEGVHVVFDDFGESDLQLLVQFYTASDDYWTAKGVISDVNVAIRRRFEAADIDFAFPTRTTRLESAGDEPLALRLEGEVDRPVEGSEGRADGGEADEGEANEREADEEEADEEGADEEGAGDVEDGPDGAGTPDEPDGSGDSDESGEDVRREGLDEDSVGDEDEEGDGDR